MKHGDRPQLKAFVRKHNGLLTYIGPMMVLSTFIVKDIIRDHYKDLSDSISAAETSFVLRRDTRLANQRLRTIEDELHFTGRNILQLMNKAGVTQTSIADLATAALDEGVDISAIAPSKRQYEDNFVSLDNTERLLDKVPRTKDERIDLGRLRVDLADVGKLLDDGAKFTNAENAGNQSEMDRLSKELRADGTAIVRDEKNERGPLTGEIDSLATRALKRAEEEKRLYGTVNSWATWFSYFLYVLGLGMGLAGRIYGITGLRGTD